MITRIEGVFRWLVTSHKIRCVRRTGSSFLFAVILFAGVPAAAEQSAPTRSDYSKNPEWFPRFYKPYTPQQITSTDLNNSPRISQMIQDGKIGLSLSQLLSAVIENNLDIAVARHYGSMAETDILRAKAGQAPRGIEGAPIPSGLFAGALGAGLGQQATGAGGIGGGGGITGQARAISVFPRGTFDPAFVLNFSQDRATSPLNTVRVAGVPTVITPTTFLQGSYQQAFTTGTSFSISFSNQRQSSTQQFLLYNPLFVSRYSVSISQQLMNGFGFAVTRRFLEVARNNRKIAEEVFRLSVISTLVQAQNLYWDLAASRENVRSAEKALAVAEQLYEDNKQRLLIGTLANLDVVSAESEAAARQRDLIVAQTDFQTKELALKTLFSKRVDAGLAAAKIDSTDPLPEPKDADIPKFVEALAAAMRNRPELRQAEGSILNQQVVIHYTKNSMRPTLSLFGIFASSALSGNRILPNPAGGPDIVIPGGLAQAFRQVGRLAYPEYAFGFTLTIPIKNRSAQADNLRARLEERQAETNLQQTRTRIGLEVRKAIIGLVQSKAQVEASRKALDLSSKLLDAEQIRLQEGVSVPYKVIQLQRDFLSAQRAAVQARVNYAKALVELARAMGVTLEKSNISVDEALEGKLLK